MTASESLAPAPSSRRARFLGVHRELVDSHLDDVATGAEPGDGDRRIAARRQRELRAVRQVQRELGDGVEALGVLQQLDVIERERDRLGHRRTSPAPAAGPRSRRRRRGAERGASSSAASGSTRSIAAAAYLISASGSLSRSSIDNHATRAPLRSAHCAQHGRLAVAGRPDDRHDGHVRRVDQPIDQRGARDDGRSHAPVAAASIRRVRGPAHAASRAPSWGAANGSSRRRARVTLNLANRTAAISSGDERPLFTGPDHPCRSRARRRARGRPR